MALYYAENISHLILQKLGNCNEDFSICSGGSGCILSGCAEGTSPSDVPGGTGGRQTTDQVTTSSSSIGGGGNDGTIVGGFGLHRTCDASGCTEPVGGSGRHDKGPGGNSGR